MRTLILEFRALAKKYREAEIRMNSIDAGDNPNAGAFADSILRQRDCLSDVERMNTKISQLCDFWKRIEAQVDPQSREEIRSAIAEAKVGALRLMRVCENHAKNLECMREKMGAELGILGKRSQHLKSIQPVKNNYPKFIDSHC
jgi:hypothetical protein